MRVSKLDAANSQLETAIELFFEERSIVSTHALAAACHQILNDLGRRCNIEPIEESFARKLGFLPEEINQIRKIARQPQNFFKHADSDPKGEIDFQIEATEFLLYSACELMNKLTGARSKHCALFQIWFQCKRPHLLIRPEDQKFFREASLKLQSNNKKAFLRFL